jgi:hypothetical protein
MAALNLTNPTIAGTSDAGAAAGVAGDSFPLPRDIIIRVTNAHAADARAVTVVGQKPCNYGTVHTPAAISVPALSYRLIRVPGGDDRFRDDTGRVQITYDSNADLTVSAYPA